MAPRIRASRTTESRRDRGINSYRCRVCRGIHPLRTCHHFLRLSPEKRLRAVLINKYCGNCLAHQHSGQDCRSGGHAGCVAKTTTLYSTYPRLVVQSARPQEHRRHLQRPTSNADLGVQPAQPRLHHVSRPVAGPPAPSVDSLLQHRSLIILPTALVVLDTGSKNFETAALIDPCTPVSCIDDSLASAFKLPTTCVGDEKVCTAVIRAKMGDFQLETLLKVEPRVRIRTPIRQLSDSVRARFGDLRLADEQFHRPATISLILGADVYPKVIQPGFLAREDGLPVAQSTVFGRLGHPIILCNPARGGEDVQASNRQFPRTVPAPRASVPARARALGGALGSTIHDPHGAHRSIKAA
ncbi:uncharacterized protein [Drosophila pseudoobscura]|uniref:Uncharacterized protein n=1 Tax=Drosophila pseudoobscura pseudoobscura TaxID=46245 RepID=A0A6I8VU15_DROPS|nr:uncharacterized protein LOC117183728 [Drosophila pseudoobscura]